MVPERRLLLFLLLQLKLQNKSDNNMSDIWVTKGLKKKSEPDLP